MGGTGREIDDEKDKKIEQYVQTFEGHWSSTSIYVSAIPLPIQLLTTDSVTNDSSFSLSTDFARNNT